MFSTEGGEKETQEEVKGEKKLILNKRKKKKKVKVKNRSDNNFEIKGMSYIPPPYILLFGIYLYHWKVIKV